MNVFTSESNPTCPHRFLGPMEHGKHGSGTEVERKWNGSGTEVGREWDGSGTEWGRNWGGSGTEEGIRVKIVHGTLFIVHY